MDIRLKSLQLEHFKCHKALTLEFDGADVCLRGDNAAGKTSVYDAFVWLLFGKDSAGNAQAEIKPLGRDGAVADHQAVTAVEAVLLTDGVPLRLRRTLHEVWNTRRGSLAPCFEGNTSEFFVDGVPCRAGAFRQRVAELVDEDTFRLLTTVNWFASTMPWQKRRELLFELFGALEDREIMDTDLRFRELREAMGKFSLEDFRKLCLTEKKGLTVKRSELPARISECERTVADLAGLDFEQAESDASFWAAECERLREAGDSGAEQTLLLQLREAELESKALEAENAAHRREQAADPEALRASLARLEANRKQLRSRLEGSEQQLRALEAERERKNASVFSGGSCPSCGQVLAGAAMRRAMTEFAEAKARTLARLEGDLAREQERMAQTAQQLEETEQELTETRRALAGIPEVQDLPDYPQRAEQLRGRVQQLRDELQAVQADSRRAAQERQSALAEAKRKLTAAQELLGRRSALAYAEGRIEQLRADEQAAAEKLARVEQLLIWMEEFGRYKASFVEEGINGRFRLASFRLFREQSNGGVEERCDVMYDGVPYLGLNTGMRTNVGIDIINTLSRACGVTVPLFVDNAESVTALEPCAGQCIRLKVDPDCPELRVA